MPVTGRDEKSAHDVDDNDGDDVIDVTRAMEAWVLAARQARYYRGRVLTRIGARNE